MAQQVTMWRGAGSMVYPTEAEADQSLKDHADLRDLTEWIYRNAADIHEQRDAEEIAITVLRGFDVKRRPS